MLSSRCALLLGIAGCVGTDNPRHGATGSDAGTLDGNSCADRSHEEAAADATRDRSTAADQGSSDVGQDAESQWWVPTRTAWTPLAWADDCGVEVAVEPERAAPPLTWRPCPGGPEGCSLFKPVAPVDDVVDLGATVAPDGGHWLGMVFFVSGAKEKRTVAYDPQGRARLVVRVPYDKCGSAQMLVGGATACLEILSLDTLGARYGCGTPEEIAKLASPTAVLPIAPQRAWFTGEIVALWVTGGMDAVFDLSTRQHHPLRSPNDFWERPSAWGSYLLAPVTRNDGQTRDGAMWKRPNDVVYLVTPAPEIVLSFNADGQYLTWVQSRPEISPEGIRSGASVWRSPFATTPGGVIPTKVRDLGDINSYVLTWAGSGYYAVQSSGDDVDVFRLSDGRHFSARAPIDWEPAGPDFVDGEYLFYTARWKVKGAFAGLIRQRLEALGPGD